MGFRFRKSVRLLPGIRLNLSKSGTSVSLGGKGLTFNVGTQGARTTVGVPGSGLSWSTRHATRGGGAVSFWKILGLALLALAVLWLWSELNGKPLLETLHAL